MRLIDADELLERIKNGEEKVMNKAQGLDLDCILLGYFAYLKRLIEDSKTIK